MAVGNDLSSSSCRKPLTAFAKEWMTVMLLELFFRQVDGKNTGLAEGLRDTAIGDAIINWSFLEVRHYRSHGRVSWTSVSTVCLSVS